MESFKKWEELTIRDNFLFQKLMLNEKICKRFLEKLLHIKIKHITYQEYEKTFELSINCKGVRFDVYVETDDGRIIDIEMQASNSKNDWLFKRARYYGSMLDLSALSKGEDYANLKKSYVIFICAFDPFGFHRKLYTFRNSCREENFDLNDGSEKMFLNTKGQIGEVDKDIDEFLKYMDTNEITGDFAREIHGEELRIKEHKELGAEYMSFMAEFHDQRREGRREGRLDTIINNARSLMQEMGWSLSETLKKLHVSPEDAAIVAKSI